MEIQFLGTGAGQPSKARNVSSLVLKLLDEINQILTEESSTDRYEKVIAVTEEPIVSTDIIGSAFAATVDLEMTRVVDGDLVKIMAWYDNEWGFTNQMIRQIQSLFANN